MNPRTIDTSTAAQIERAKTVNQRMLDMSAEDRDTLTRAGDGVLSLGVQRAAAALRRQS